jgi:hypothetical protein
MAICFELVVNFGDNLEAARSAALTYFTTLPAGSHRVPLHQPILNTTGSHIELAVLPVSVSWGTPMDGTIPQTRLSAAELTELGQRLYGLLAKFSGYVAAIVGWDPEGLVDFTEFTSDCTDYLADGSIDGLVLSETLHAKLGLGENYVEFQPGYRWIPYRGASRGTDD